MTFRVRSNATALVSASTWVLSLGGVFVTGTLTYAHFSHLALPCGVAQGGCDRVARDPHSVLLGVPVALYGLAAFILLAIFAGFRLRQGVQPRQVPFILSAALSYAGLVASLYFSIVAALIIRAFCMWCLFSSVIFALVALAHTFLSNRTVPRASNPTKLHLVGLCTLISVSLFQFASLDRPLTVPRYDALAFSSLSMSDLIPADRPLLGPPTATTTIVLFVDGECGGCARAYEEARAIMRGRSDVRLVIRYNPLSVHPKAMEDAVACEIARERGKYWSYLDQLLALYRDQPADKLLSRMGILPADFRLRLRDPSDPAYRHIVQDKALTAKLHIAGSPFIVLVNGNVARPLTDVEIEKHLKSNPMDRSGSSPKFVLAER